MIRREDFSGPLIQESFHLGDNRHSFRGDDELDFLTRLEYLLGRGIDPQYPLAQPNPVIDHVPQVGSPDDFTLQQIGLLRRRQRGLGFDRYVLRPDGHRYFLIGG